MYIYTWNAFLYIYYDRWFKCNFLCRALRAYCILSKYLYLVQKFHTSHFCQPTILSISGFLLLSSFTKLFYVLADFNFCIHRKSQLFLWLSKPLHTLCYISELLQFFYFSLSTCSNASWSCARYLSGSLGWLGEGVLGLEWGQGFLSHF
jgi:hypothetical protein